MIMMARKNSTYQFVAMLLQFNFNVKVNRTTEGDDLPDVLEVHSMKYNETNTMTVYGSIDENGTFTIPTEDMKKDLADLMAVVNYADGTVVVYRRDFFLKNVKQLVDDGAITKLEDGSWQIYPEALSGIFKLHQADDGGQNLDYVLWEHEGRMAYYYQRVEMNFKRDVV